jgi:sterol desaturase/sphingolipid hydroxylase (fatty acid hydroxylase superfamily)
MIANLVPWLVYPATMGVCLGLYGALRAATVPLPWAMYLPAFLGAGLVTFFEWRVPHRAAWQPDRATVANDLAYMTLVQMLLPPGVAFLFVLALIEPLNAAGLTFDGLWPKAWPAWAQAALMLLAADFLRYWLHRASHRYSPLWRLHAVHHSPERLYWLNVGRFHPLEKALQMTLDTLPFMVLGVGPDVIALYFVFYAVNGFFQHSNIHMRFGWLNWIVSSAELHRWHHARHPDESNHNFGNNLIVWDGLFGTRYLPENRDIDDLGLPNRHYPAGFFAQLRTPFVAHIAKRAAPMPPLPAPLGAGVRLFKRVALQGLMATYRHRYWRPLARRAAHPAAAQATVLRTLLARNRDSRFGREHRFAAIVGIDAFRTQVPVQQYEDLRPYIEAQMAGEAALTVDAPVLYTLTSGTTGQPKYVPVVPEALRQHRRSQRLYTWLQYQACPQAFHGPALGLVGSAVEDRNAQGTPVGSISGTLYASMPSFMRARYVAPAEVFAIADYDLKYRTLAQLALRHPDLSYLAGANPSSFLRLQAVLNEHRDELVTGIEQGSFAGQPDFSPELQHALMPHTLPLPDRAADLRALDGPLTLAKVWPGLRLLATWTGGSCGIALARLERDLPPGCTVFDIGYVSTEFRGTVSLSPGQPGGLPLFDQHLYEFVEQRAWDAGRPVFLGLHELVEGPLYYVIVTTCSGLYRYFMNDLVAVDGWLAATPLLRFIQKGRGVTSITGEKIYEGQFLDAMRELDSQHRGLFYLLLADEDASRYVLLLEPGSACDAEAFADALDQALASRNMEYRDKRASGRLSRPLVRLLRAGAGDACKQHGLARGQREGQFKYLALQYQRECTFGFDAWSLN